MTGIACETSGAGLLGPFVSGAIPARVHGGTMAEDGGRQNGSNGRHVPTSSVGEEFRKVIVPV